MRSTPLSTLAMCHAPPFPALQADKFHKTGRQLRSRMWWQNMKMKLIILAILILIAVIIFCAVCFSGGNCLK
jgi:hypothetical protein